MIPNVYTWLPLAMYCLNLSLPRSIQTLISLSTTLSLLSPHLFASAENSVGVYQGNSANNMIGTYLSTNTDGSYNVAGFTQIGITLTTSKSLLLQVDQQANLKWVYSQDTQQGQNYFISHTTMMNPNTKKTMIYSAGSSLQNGVSLPYLSANNLNDGSLETAWIFSNFASSTASIQNIIATSDGVLLCVGLAGSSIHMTKFDPASQTVIAAHYITIPVGAIALQVRELGEQSYVISGYTQEAVGRGLLIKVHYQDKTLIHDWTNFYSGSFSSIKSLINAATSINDNIFFAGLVSGDMLIGAVNKTTGVLKWVNAIGGTGNLDMFNDIVLSNNELIITGQSNSGTIGGIQSAVFYAMDLNGNPLRNVTIVGSKNIAAYASFVHDKGISSILRTQSYSSVGASAPMFINFNADFTIAGSVLPSTFSFSSKNNLVNNRQAVTQTSGTSSITPFVPSVTDITNTIVQVNSSAIKSIYQQATTPSPTSQPSMQPSRQPTVQPSSRPSVRPSSWPTKMPSGQPSTRPTLSPSKRPNAKPTTQPTTRPSSRPSRKPSIHPSAQPSRQPTVQPSTRPTLRPSKQPSVQPTNQPSMQPSRQPTVQPSSRPSIKPSSWPTKMPSGQPSTRPTLSPTKRPSVKPTGQPSHTPSARPTFRPSLNPSSQSRRTPIVNASNRTKLSSSEISAIVICIVFLSTLAPFVLKKNRSWLKQKTQGFFSAEQKPKFNQILPDLTKLEEGTMTQAPQDLSSDNRLSPHRRDSLLILLSQLYIKIQKQTDPVHPETLESIQEKLSNTIGRISSNVTTPEQALNHQSSSLDQDDDSISLNLKLLLDHEEMMRNKIDDFMSRTDERCTTPTPSEFAAMDQYYDQRRASIIRENSDRDSSSSSDFDLH